MILQKKYYKLLIFVLSIVILSSVFYVYRINTNPTPNADEAVVLLEVKDFLSGNILMRDWNISTVSFYTAILSNSIVALFIGINSNTLYVTSSILYAILVILGCFLAGIYYDNDEKSNYKFSFFNSFIVFCLIGLPIVRYSQFILVSAIHVETYILILLSFYFINKVYYRNGKLYALLFAYLPLLIGAIGDDFAIYGGIIPLICIFSLLLLIRKDYDTCRIKYYANVLLCIITGVSAKAILFLIKSCGGMKIPGTGQIKILKFEDILNNILFSLHYLSALFSGDVWEKALFSINTVKLFPNLLFMFISILALVRIIKNFKNINLISLMLAMSSIIVFCAYTFSNMLVKGDIATSRYLISSFIFMAACIGQSDIISFLTVKIKRIFPRARLLIACFAIISLISKAIPISFNAIHENSYSSIAKYLIDNKYTNGYGTYWNSHSVSIAGNLELTVSPIIQNNSTTKTVGQFRWLSNDKWYDRSANYVIIDDTNWGTVNEDSIITTFGKPNNIKKIDNKTIFTWDYNIQPYLADLTRNPQKVINGASFNRNNMVDIVDKTCAYIKSGGILFGPYIPIKRGEYIVTVYGDNLQYAAYDVYSNSLGGVQNPTSNLSALKNNISYSFKLNRDTSDVEFRFFNKNSDRDVKIDKVEIERK
jgi:hypothetical protein